MKQRVLTLMAVLMAVLLLAGCGAKATMNESADQKFDYFYSGSTAGGSGWDADSPMEAPSAPETETLKDGQLAENGSIATDRKLIQTAWLELETREYEQSLAALEALIEASGGYIESRQEQGVSYYNTGRYAARYASLTARIPADRLESVLGEAGTLCNLVNRETSISDVTESYTDTEARLATLRLQEERLLEILSKATTLTDVLELESRLSDVRYQIERYEANLRNLDSRISYSTLHLSLQEVVEYSVVTNPPQTLAERLSEGLNDTFRSIKNGAEDFLVWLVVSLPILAIWAVILGGLGWIAVRIFRRNKDKVRLPRRKKKGEQSPAEEQK